MKKKQLLIANFILSLVLISLLRHVAAQGSYPEDYENPRFWDQNLNYCFFYQKTNVSCVPAAVQMVLKYLDFSPLPNQSELANEMHSDVNHTTSWEYTYISLVKRGFHNYYNQSLSNDFNQALSNLKGNISQNFPAIIITWYDESAKNASIRHARVVTGYNSTGVFLHEPWYALPYTGPNIFLNNSVFSSLWKTDYGFWALIIKHEPRFNLFINASDIFGSPILGASVTVNNRINETGSTDSNGTVKFFNIPMSNYTLIINWRFESREDVLSLTKTTTRHYTFVFSDQAIIIVFFIVIVISAGGIIFFRIMTRRVYK